MPDLWMDVDTALAEVPVNTMPLIDDTDFKTREIAIVYNQAGMDLVWNFVTTAGAYTQTAVTPTDGTGVYDWAHQGDGMYSIEIPASGGVSINNDAEGFGWFTGICTGVLPWRGPVIGFRAVGLNDKLVDSAYSATRGLAGTAVPDAAADAVGGLPISDAGGLALDTILDAAITTRATPAQVNTEVDAALDTVIPAPTSGSINAAIRDMRDGLFLRRNTAQGGAAGSITLDAGASASDGFYVPVLVVTVSGAGNGQARLGYAYNGTTKVLSIAPNWIGNPDATTVFQLISLPRADIGAWLSVIANALVSGRVDASVGAVAASAINAAALAADTDTYQSKVGVVDDDTAGADRYLVIFYKNGQPVISGITSPDIWVYRNNGTDLVGTSGAPTALTQIGATGTYTLDEATSRMVDGSAYIARVRATIDSSTRTWYQFIGRDTA